LSKNSLYITFDGLSDPLGQSQILPYLCGIAANGYSITILSCEKNERLLKEKDTISGLIKDLPITWISINYNEEGGALSRLNYLRKLYRLAEKNIAEKNISLVHCRSYLPALLGLRLKTKYGVPFIFDMRGFWADERLDGGIWKKTNLIQGLFYSYFKKKEKQFLFQSKAIVSLTNAAVNELKKQFPEAKLNDKTKVIPCCTNTDLFDPRHTASASLTGIRTGDHVIIYTGSIGTWYFTREMIDCMLVWQKQIPNLKLLIVTKDIQALQDVLRSYSTSEKELIVYTSSSYKEVPSFLALAKAAIFFIKPSYSKIASSPTKMAECWAMNLPIITNAGIGDNDLYFNTLKGGILLDRFTEENYKRALRDYLDLDPGRNYRSIALEHYNTETAVKIYSELYQFVSGA
jgi:glycosyltransferase involved in cell wall biosynthesis